MGKKNTQAYLDGDRRDRAQIALRDVQSEIDRTYQSLALQMQTRTLLEEQIELLDRLGVKHRDAD